MTHELADANGLSFIHIPKNAGTSIRQVVVENALPIRLIGHAYPAKFSEQEFVVLRCPTQRFVSAFRYSRARWPNQINRRFADANELAVCAADPDHPMHALAWVELGNRPEDYLRRNGTPESPQTVATRVTTFPWIYEPQSTWLVNDPLHILRYRYLAEDFSALLGSVGLPENIPLPRTNEGDSGHETLSAEARSFVERTYARDFDFIRLRGLDV